MAAAARALALGALVGVAALSRGAQAASSCSDCSDSVCMLDGSATSITGGATSLSVQFCNFDTSNNASYALAFGVTSVPSCDADNATLPVAKSLVAADSCTSDACAVTVNFEEAVDWAIALQNDGASNALTAQLTSGGSSETVTVATFETMAAAVMNSGSDSISVCASEISVSGSRFSTLDACNVATLCQGSESDTSCVTQLQTGALVGDVSCDGESCSGSVQLSEALPCDGSSGDSTALLVGVQVASSTQSNYASVGSMTTPNFTISDASGVNVGSSELELTTGTFCAYSSLQLNVSAETDDESDGSSGSTGSVSVGSLNSTSNGTVVVELSSPLSASLEDVDLQLSLSQCGVSASASFAVGEADDDSETSNSASDASAGGSDASVGSVGTESTQEDDSSTGLSHGVIVGIVIAVVAVGGFVFEYTYHKRRQPMPARQDSSSNLATPL